MQLSQEAVLVVRSTSRPAWRLLLTHRPPRICPPLQSGWSGRSRSSEEQRAHSCLLSDCLIFTDNTKIIIEKDDLFCLFSSKAPVILLICIRVKYYAIGSEFILIDPI